MRLLDLLNKYERADVKSRGASPTYRARMLQSLRLFLAGRPGVDALALVDHELVKTYAIYLFGGGYAQADREAARPGRKGAEAASTPARHFQYLRTIARQAMRDGLLPAVDVFPRAKAEALRELGLKAAATAGKDYKPRGANLKGELERLVACVAADMQDRHRMGSAVPALLYILGLCCYGIEIADLLLLPLPAQGQQPAANVRGSAFALPLTERAMGLVEILNRQKPAGDRLLRRHADWQGADEMARGLALRLESYLQAKGIGLYRSRSVMADWLALACEHGAGAEEIAALLPSPPGEQAKALLRDFGSRIADDHGAFCKRWYVCVSYSAKLGSSDLKELVKDYLRQEGVDFNCRRDLYDPHDVKRLEVRGRMIKKNNPAISRFLFVNCRLDTAMKIDRMDSRASMMRVPGSPRRLATVPHAAILTLAEFLRDYREDVELLGMSIPKDTSEFAIGVKVKILSGELKGLTGVITKIAPAAAAKPQGAAEASAAPSHALAVEGASEAKPQHKASAAKPATRTEALKTKEDTCLYTIELSGFAMTAKAKASLPGLSLQPVPALPA